LLTPLRRAYATVLLQGLLQEILRQHCCRQMPHEGVLALHGLNAAGLGAEIDVRP